MRTKKQKLTIFLADLTHTGIRIATENIPLNIGLIASYALKKFGSGVEVRLFKYPEKLLEALKHEKYDILACSSYIWNDSLAEWAFETARKYNPEVMTVRGGWNFPLDQDQQKKYLDKRRSTDIFCINEGEIAFANVIERVLSAENGKDWDARPIDGCAFIKDGELVKGSMPLRIKEMDSIPSPYTTGILDEFFDGNLTPIIETSRGCPFKCNYCNNSDDYYNKVNFFSFEYVRDEVAYIAGRIASKNVRNLLIADTNFGMYPRDREIAVLLRKMQEQYHWPLGIIASTGKNNAKRIIENTEILRNSLIISLSVQSMNADTLGIIKRDNISFSAYKEISDDMKKKGMSQMAEVIVPLPEETYDSYMAGLEKLFDIGAQRIVSYTLQLNNGTVYKNTDYRDKYGYKGQFRLIPYDFGVYDGEKVFDYEEVAAFSNSLPFGDYLKIRKLALLGELVFSCSIFEEMFKCLGENGIGAYKFLNYAFEDIESAEADVKNVFDSFLKETKAELKNTEEELVSYYSNDKNYERLKAGEIGCNLIFKYKGIMLSRHMLPWIEFVFLCAGNILEAKTGKKLYEIDEIKSFVTAKLDGLFSAQKTHESVAGDFRYDILSWLKNQDKNALRNFKSANGFIRYNFYFNDEQKSERNDLFRRYGSDVLGLSRIMARVPSLERMFRKVEKISQ